MCRYIYANGYKIFFSITGLESPVKKKKKKKKKDSQKDRESSDEGQPSSSKSSNKRMLSDGGGLPDAKKVWTRSKKALLEN